MADESKYRAILEGMGWFREDSNFLSLNFTDDQIKVVQRAVAAGGGETPEEALCAVLRRGLGAEATKVAA